ncbi:hypothetical protein T03_8656 [Trichinella britovi]|uniref:Uncharacterized protein n=1 Tax=Trichinella britovi TaxID=45882 RepID=A0A0V1CGU5_TRIBR|nr:hypothetical protein T03_8656 [Trichinella britovi]
MAYENFQAYVAKSSNALKTDFQRCIMQITIAITLPYHQFKRMEQRKCENTDDTRQNKRREEIR